jgi:glycosyltransferase involved in cell wall biosynthesis
VLEAMALGIPVASTDYSDIRRILPLSAQVAASRNPEDVAQTVIWACNEGELIASKQKEWVCANATIEKAASSLENVYRKYIRPPILVPAGEPC